MQSNTTTEKIFEMVGRAANTFMVGLGTVTFIWILAFIIVALVEG